MKTMTFDEANNVEVEASKIKTIFDMAKVAINNLYDRLIKDIGDAKRTKERIESALHDVTMKASSMVVAIVKDTGTFDGASTTDIANALVAWRMRFKEEQESVKVMVEANNDRINKLNETLYFLEFDSQKTNFDSQTVLPIIFDTVDKASYVDQRQRAFEEKYKDYIPLATKINELSNELYKVNRRLDQNQRDLARVKDIDRYLFGSPKASTPANPSFAVDELRVININLASQDSVFLLTPVGISSVAYNICAIETDMTPQEWFFLMAALVIVTVTRK